MRKNFVYGIYEVFTVNRLLTVDEMDRLVIERLYNNNNNIKYNNIKTE